MTRFRHPFCLAAALTAAIAGLSAPAAQERPAEVRGLWVLRATLASPETVSRMVTSASQAGINTLFVQVRARGDAYYASEIEPRGSLLAGQPAPFDPLAQVLREAHAKGMAVHAWVNVGLVADATHVPAPARHIVRAHPEWLMVPRELASTRRAPRDPAFVPALAAWTRRNIARVEGLYASPITSGARAYAAGIARDLSRRYALDGLHLDYVRYPHDGFDYSAGALAEFRASLSADIPPEELAALDARAAAAPALFADRYPQRWETFRRARVTALVAGMAAAARAER
ncbi:MAG: family 10 glycosylhydrolase, partial [Acidobacteriota bacterium]|nr:family 10 glycosylhydrolase [Acidobacteriota bacterium]